MFGCYETLLKFWTKGPLRTRLGPRVVKAISVKCLGLRTYIPSEFARKPRDLKDIDRWKATEFREFLLYTGPVALLGSLCDELYHNFMLLSIAMLLLLNPRYCLHYCQYAHELLVLFVQHYGQLYGQDMITYNVHGLVHLSDEVKRFGSLDNISCFPFENYLGQLKRKVRKPSSPLEQVIRRISEQSQSHETSVKPFALRKPHCGGPIPREVLVSSEYKELQTNKYTLNIAAGNNCVQIGSHIALVRNFCTIDQNDYVVYERFARREDFFQYPLPSSHIGVYKVSHLCSILEHTLVRDILKKYVMLPHGNAYIAIPLLHC